MLILMGGKQFLQLSKPLLQGLGLLFEFLDITLFWAGLLSCLFVATKDLRTLREHKGHTKHGRVLHSSRTLVEQSHT